MTTTLILPPVATGTNDLFPLTDPNESSQVNTNIDREQLPNVATYISSSNITPDLYKELQHIFNTYKVFPEIDAMEGYIAPAPDSSWAIGLNPLGIFARHQEENVSRYLYDPVVILDEQTARDMSVVIVSGVINEQEQEEAKMLRIAPQMVQVVASNLEIANQALDDVRIHALQGARFD